MEIDIKLWGLHVGKNDKYNQSHQDDKLKVTVNRQSSINVVSIRWEWDGDLASNLTLNENTYGSVTATWSRIMATIVRIIKSIPAFK